MRLTIREAAARTGLTAHTLRYYERIGLLGDVDRGGDGHRRYNEADLDRLKILICLRGCGMSIQGLQAFVALYAEGDDDGRKRSAMLEAQRLVALDTIERVQAHIAMIDTKLAMLDRLRTRREAPAEQMTPVAD